MERGSGETTLIERRASRRRPLDSGRPIFAPGARVVTRAAEWVIRRVDRSPDGGCQLVCDGCRNWSANGRRSSSPRWSPTFAIADLMKEHDLAHVALEAGAVDSAETEGVRLATMHRVKGLEFDRVVMASMNADLVPLPAALDGRGDAVERDSAETEERALVYVAATRAKKELLVLGFGTPSRLL